MHFSYKRYLENRLRDSFGFEGTPIHIICRKRCLLYTSGNSGGALVNMAGELVGITSMKLSNTSVEGMGFALPINDVITSVEQIIENGKVTRPQIGISGAVSYTHLAEVVGKKM